MNEGRAGCTDNLFSFEDSSNYAKEGKGVFEMVLIRQRQKELWDKIIQTEIQAFKDKIQPPIEDNENDT